MQTVEQTVERKDAVDNDIVAQAAEVATAAVRAMLIAALRSATTCRCASCRATATTTHAWAAAYLRVEPVSLVRRQPPRLPGFSL
ncbi:MAG: hypothetical protein IT340_14635 [Chloroflexi bacterium]|nr:hypothetical protein [Chloroflexota bacterium]